jgi:hypothetical protein
MNRYILRFRPIVEMIVLYTWGMYFNYTSKINKSIIKVFGMTTYVTNINTSFIHFVEFCYFLC